MSITKRVRKSGTRWTARISRKGQKEVCRTFERKADAQAWERRQIEAAQMSPTSSSEQQKVEALRLGEFCEQWFQKHCLARNTQSTARSSGDIIRNHIIPALGHVHLSDLTAAQIEDWQVQLLHDKGLSAKTVNNCVSCLKKILGDACRWKHLETSPAQHVQRLKLTRVEPRFWTQVEATRFLEQLAQDAPRFQPVFSLALYTGMRKGEIRGLEWGCVDFATQTVLVKQIYCSEQKALLERTKGGGSRRVPMNRPLQTLLIDLRNRASGDGLVFPDQFPWNHTHRLLRKVGARAGVPIIRFHDLRHSFASNLVMKGRSLYEVQKLLGHADFRMTQRYAHLSPDHLRGTTDCLDFEAESQTQADSPILAFGGRGCQQLIDLCCTLSAPAG